jgi:hypothetical protein
MRLYGEPNESNRSRSVRGGRPREAAGRPGWPPPPHPNAPVPSRITIAIFTVLRPRDGATIGLGGRTRTTKEMDLIRNDSEEAATADLISAQAVDLGDFFTFDIEKVGAPDEDLEGAAMRYRVRAEPGGRLFEDVIVDVAFSDPLKWEPEKIAGTRRELDGGALSIRGSAHKRAKSPCPILCSACPKMCPFRVPLVITRWRSVGSSKMLEVLVSQGFC